MPGLPSETPGHQQEAVAGAAVLPTWSEEMTVHEVAGGEGGTRADGDAFLRRAFFFSWEATDGGEGGGCPSPTCQGRVDLTSSPIHIIVVYCHLSLKH